MRRRLGGRSESHGDMIDLYSFQHYDDLVLSFVAGRAYRPSMALARRSKVDRDHGDSAWWDVFEPAYQWIMMEMDSAVGCRPSSDAAPVWAWARWVDARGRVRVKPDLRYAGFRGAYPGLDLVHLRVDESRVLLTDFDCFHMVLNDTSCIPRDLPGDDADDWLDRHREEFEEWKRRNWHDNVIVPHDAMPVAWIQATLWEVREGDVVDVRRLPRR